MPVRLVYALGLVATLAACGDDPVQFSAPVGINLKAKSSDTTNGVVSEEKAITTESGNPYGAFISDARAKLGGKDPSSIQIDKVELFLGAGSTNVTRLGEVFDGTVDVVFQINDTNNSYPAASGSVPSATAAGPIEIGPSFDSGTLPDADYQKLLGGSFKITARGPAAAGFTTKGADADIQVTFTFAAFQ